MNPLYRWKILISDFFNKVPAIILIPGILLASFLIAVFLIWSGMRVATIEVKEPYESGSNTNASGKKKGVPASSGEANLDGSYNGEGTQSGSGKYSPENSRDATGVKTLDLNPQDPSSVTGSGGADQPQGGAASSSTNSNSSGDQTSGRAGNSSQSPDQQGSSSSSSSASPSESRSSTSSSTSTSTSTNSNSNSNNNTSGNCTYPEGDVELWWRRAPKSQRDCYIKENGFPDFLSTSPYFCDYDKNEDCYIP